MSKEEKWAGGGWSQVAVEGKARFCKKAFHARKISGRSYNLFWIVGRIHGIAATSWPPPGLTGFLSTTLLPQICASRLTFFTLRRISEEIQFLSRTVLAPGIDKSLALERKIESRKRNFSLDLENLMVSISLSTLDFREW